MKTWQSLSYLGLLPFFISLVLSFLVQDWQSSALQVFIFYSAIILSFISGTFWHAAVKQHNTKQQVISNIFSLLAFCSLMLSQSMALIVLALSYLFIFLYEKSLMTRNSTTKKYIKVRFQLTVIVVLLHCCASILSF